jgi:hypothetical protein
MGKIKVVLPDQEVNSAMTSTRAALGNIDALAGSIFFGQRLAMLQIQFSAGFLNFMEIHKA